MAVAEPTVPPMPVPTVVAARTLPPGAVGRTVVAAPTPPPAAAVIATLHRVVEVAEAILPVAVVATAADTDKLALFVSPKTGAAAGTSTQPVSAPAFLLKVLDSLVENQTCYFSFLRMLARAGIAE